MVRHLVSPLKFFLLPVTAFSMLGGPVTSALSADYISSALTQKELENSRCGTPDDSQEHDDNQGGQPLNERVLSSLITAPVLKQVQAEVGTNPALFVQQDDFASDAECGPIVIITPRIHSGLKLPVYRAQAPPSF